MSELELSRVVLMADVDVGAMLVEAIGARASVLQIQEPDVVAALDASGWRDGHVVAASKYAVLAVSAACEHRDRVQSLTLITPAAERVASADELAAVTQPSLVIGRPGDAAHPFAVALHYVAHIAGARRIDDDPARPPLWERPIELAAIVVQFVASVERARGQ